MELGWVKCECDQRSEAENTLREMAAMRYERANSLTKLSYSLRRERYQAGTGPKGNPYYRNRTVKIWEAMACEAIPKQHVDKSPVRWNKKIAVIDGSNVAHWGENGAASLDAVKAIISFLKRDGARSIVVFDANIGFKVSGRRMSDEEIRKYLGKDIDVEIVRFGTVADTKIIKLAEKLKAPIVSNDLFRDSIRARHISKRRGFYLKEYDYGELLPPRA